MNWGDVLNGLHGGAKYAAAWFAGDKADFATIEARQRTCAECPSKKVVQLPVMRSPSSWCGQPLHDGLGDDPPTCGCLVAGKTVVGSERCPQGKW